MFKFTLTIATSAFLFMSGTADLFAMDSLDDLDGKSGKQLVIAKTEDAEPRSINHMPKDVTGVILYETSKIINPRRLTCVCKLWYSVMRENNIPEVAAELHYAPTNILASAMNPFMQRCMETYWDNLHYNGILQCTPTDGSTAVTQKFSGLKDTDGTFNLSTCKTKTTSLDQYLVITESMDRFFMIEKENKGKTVIGIMPCHRILQAIKNVPGHPFFPLLAKLDPDKASEVLLFRWGNDKDLTWFDDLITACVRDISSKNLYENWGHAREGRGARPHSTTPPARTRGLLFTFMFIFEQK